MVLGFLMNCLLHGFTLRCMVDKGRTEREMLIDWTQCNIRRVFILKVHELIGHMGIHFTCVFFQFHHVFKFQFTCLT